MRPVGSSGNRLCDAHEVDEQNISVPSRGLNRRCGIEHTWVNGATMQGNDRLLYALRDKDTAGGLFSFAKKERSHIIS